MVFFLFPELTLCGEREGGRVSLRDRVVASPWDGELGLCAGSFPGGRWGEAAFGLAGARVVQGSFRQPREASRSHPADFSLFFPISFFPPGRTKPYRT